MRVHLAPLCLAALLWPATTPAQPACQPPDEAVLAALTAARSVPRTCGDRLLPAAPPLRPSAALAESARRYAAELARREQLTHLGETGQTLRGRLHEAGYTLRLAGENLAGGQETLDEVLAQWAASPAHCQTMMGAGYEDFGLACVRGGGPLQRYWVLHVGAPAGRR